MSYALSLRQLALLPREQEPHAEAPNSAQAQATKLAVAHLDLADAFAYRFRCLGQDADDLRWLPASACLRLLSATKKTTETVLLPMLCLP